MRIHTRVRLVHHEGTIISIDFFHDDPLGGVDLRVQPTYVRDSSSDNQKFGRPDW